jgi:hypothetical protein
MLARAGRIVYWVGCGLAALILAFGVYLYFIEFKNRDEHLLAAVGFVVAALLVWIAGLLARYIISDE